MIKIIYDVRKKQFVLTDGDLKAVIAIVKRLNGFFVRGLYVGGLPASVGVELFTNNLHLTGTEIKKDSASFFVMKESPLHCQCQLALIEKELIEKKLEKKQLQYQIKETTKKQKETKWQTAQHLMKSLIK